MRATHRKKGGFWVGGAIFFALAVFSSSTFYFLMKPVVDPRAKAETKVFEIKQGEGFRAIVNNLDSENLIKSPTIFKIYLLINGKAKDLKPGKYELDPRMSAPRIINLLVTGPEREVSISIPEGLSVFEIDAILAEKKIIKRGDLVDYSKRNKEIEGKLFPDTYNFYFESGPEEVSRKMLANFEKKVMPLLSGRNDLDKKLIIASMLEKEMPDFEERKIAAGILEKRLKNDMPLQVDATLCYIKKIRTEGEAKCYPLTQLDKQLDSPYNTYIYKGLPPGPISNPGLFAIKAALDPEASPYWYYLSDPITKKTIFAETLDTHRANRVKYLLNS